MLNDTKTYLRAILKAVPVKSILELGSGLRSTPFLGNIMEQRQGKMTTLETDPTWYQTVCEKVKFKCLTPVLCNFLRHWTMLRLRLPADIFQARA